MTWNASGTRGALDPARWEFNAIEIYEAGRAPLTEALQRSGSKARNERGQLSVSQFKAVGLRIWAT